MKTLPNGKVIPSWKEMQKALLLDMKLNEAYAQD